MRTRSTPPARLTALFAGIITCAVAAVTFTASRDAHAEGRFIDLRAEALVGGMIGRGSNSTDFFRQAQGPGFGFELGLRLLVLDFSLRFVQTLGSDGLEEALILLPMFGPSLEIPLIGGGTDLNGKRRAPKMVLRPGVMAGFALGTSSPIHGQIADQLAAKGLIVMGRCGVERFFGPLIGLEAHVEGGYHYLLNGEGIVNGPASDHSQGWQLGAFGGVVLHLGI